jgi:hypothetical protein
MTEQQGRMKDETASGNPELSPISWLVLAGPRVRIFTSGVSKQARCTGR